MNFFERLDNLRAKPEAARRRLVLLFSLSITGVILIGWVIYFTKSVPTIIATGGSAKEVVAPFSYLKTEIQNAVKSFGESREAIEEAAARAEKESQNEGQDANQNEVATE